MRRRVLVLLLLALLLLPVGVARAADVLIWDYVPWRVDFYQAYATEYMKLHPGVNINVEVIPLDGYVDKIKIGIAVGTPPTMFSFHPTFITDFVGTLRPFPHDLFPHHELSESLLGFDSLVDQGEFYYYPLGMQGGMLYVNTESWAAAGLGERPHTWDEAFAMGRRATRSVDGQTQVAGLYFDSNIPDLFIDLLYQHGGSFYKEGGLEVDFADPAGIAAISFVNELYRSGVSGAAGEALAFQNGQMAMRYIWAWYGQQLMQFENLDWTVFPLPTLSGEIAPNMMRMDYYFGMAAPVGGDDQAAREAFEFIHWVYSDDTRMMDLNSISWTLPARRSLWGLPEISENPVLRTLTQTLPFAAYPGEVPRWLLTELNAMVADVRSGAKDPVITLQEIVPTINARLKVEPPALVTR